MTATPHDHRTHVPGCFRCELSADEVTATPARDALADLLYDDWPDTWSGWYVRGLDAADRVEIYDLVRPLASVVVANPDVVVAALVESGWRPTADQLRAMGGERMTTQVLPGRLVKCWTFPEGVDGDL